MSNPETTPYRVMESSVRGNRYMVVDDLGEAELGNWFVCSTWHRCDADYIARLLNEHPMDTAARTYVSRTTPVPSA